MSPYEKYYRIIFDAYGYFVNYQRRDEEILINELIIKYNY